MRNADVPNQGVPFRRTVGIALGAVPFYCSRRLCKMVENLFAAPHPTLLVSRMIQIIVISCREY